MPIYVAKAMASDSLQTEAMQLRLTENFKQYDTNRDGQLNKAELKEAFRYLGSHIPGWRAHRAPHHADADGDGCISEEEMKDLVEYATKFGYTL